MLLTWYQSHSSDFLVPVDISGIFPLPSPSSNSHCQKWVTAVTPTAPKTLGFRQFCWSNYQSQGTNWQIFRSRAKPNKELLETTLHAPPRASRSFCLTSTRCCVWTCARNRDFTRFPRAYFVSRTDMSALGWRHTATSAHVSILSRWPSHWHWPDRWPLTLTKVKIFQRDLSCSVFRVDSDFGLCFCIWGL